MLTGTFRSWVHADPGVLWSVILESVENPQRYVANVEECRVLERQGGGVIREVTCGGCEPAPGVFDFFVVDGGVLREIKSTDDRADSVHGVFRFFSFESVIVREVSVQGERYREKILISTVDREIRRELVDHPASKGTIAIKVVPISVQNPMAPVDLQFQAALEPSASHAGEYTRWHEETMMGIREEQLLLKEVAEEREMRS